VSLPAKPGRLLIAVTDLEIGGTPTVIEAIAPRLAALGWTVTVASLSRIGPIGERLQSAGINVIAMDGRGGLDVRVLIRLRKHLQSTHYHACLAFLFHAHAALRVATTGLTVKPPVVHVFQTTQPDPAWHWKIEKRLIASAAAIVGPTPSVATAIEKYTGYPAPDCIIIPNGVDIPANLPPRMPAAANQFRVGFLGRLDRVKRVDVLIEAVKGQPDVHLSIAGDGGEFQTLQQLAAANSNITFDGLVTNKWAWLARQDMLVLPSEAEGFGLVLIEAMAGGVPVIGARSPGITDIINDQINGLLFTPHDPADLRRAINTIRADSALRGRLITHGQQTAAHYSWPAAVAGYDELLRQL
jgi:glycosyltransferase involved in cell wall biosynthesis